MYLVLSLLLFSTGMLMAQPPGNFEKDLAEVEQFYIPALFLTGHGPKEKAPKAVTRFKQVWQAFTEKHAAELRNEPWASAVKKIEAHIQAAVQKVAEGKTGPAHRELEPIRNILAEVRHQEGNATLMDALTVFHDHMEVIVKTLRRKKLDALAEEDIQKLTDHAKKAADAWKRVKIGDAEKALYGLSAEAVQYLQDAIAQQQQTIQNLLNALNEKNKAEISRHGLALRSGFITIFRNLGKFE